MPAVKTGCAGPTHLTDRNLPWRQYPAYVPIEHCPWDFANEAVCSLSEQSCDGHGSIVLRLSSKARRHFMSVCLKDMFRRLHGLSACMEKTYPALDNLTPMPDYRWSQPANKMGAAVMALTETWWSRWSSWQRHINQEIAGRLNESESTRPITALSVEDIAGGGVSGEITTTRGLV